MPTTWRGVAHRDRQVLGLEPHDLALDGRPVAHQHRGEAELAARRHRALDHDGGAEVASHGVDRDLHGADLWHGPAQPERLFALDGDDFAPLVEAALGQIWWGGFTSRHCGQSERVGATIL